MAYKYMYIPGESVDGSSELDAEIIEKDSGWRTHTKGPSLDGEIYRVHRAVDPTIVRTSPNLQAQSGPSINDMMPSVKVAGNGDSGMAGPFGFWKFPIWNRLKGRMGGGIKWSDVIVPDKSTGTPPDLSTDTVINNKDSTDYRCEINKSYTAHVIVRRQSTGSVLREEDRYVEASEDSPAFIWMNSEMRSMMATSDMEYVFKIIEIGEKNIEDE